MAFHKLSIRNYGANERLDIDLDPHVTCITGESYRGKSWVTRAIKWTALNRPSGTRFIRWGSKQCVVRIETEKHKVVRKRGKSVNSYEVDGHPLKAFGNNVPDKVRRILNLSEINFQVQQEMPHGDGPLFWFALTTGQVSKRLNAIVNLDVIDRTLGNLQTVVHKAKATLDVCRERRKDAKEKAESLAYVEEMAGEWEEVKQAVERSETLDREADELEALLTDVSREQTSLRATKSQLDDADKDLRELESLRTTIIEVDRRHLELYLLLGEIGRLDRERGEAYEDLIVAEKEYNKALGDRCPLCGNRRNK
jgi:DNA repair protein SbcC/Rad50